MSSIERTAYPRFASGHVLKEQELEQFYSLTPDEMYYINQHVRGPLMQLNFAVQLKTFQRLGYFAEFKNVPSIIIDHIKKCLGLFDSEIVPYYDHEKTRYLHRNQICSYLKVTRWKKNKNHVQGEPTHPGRHLAVDIAYQAAQTMNNPADIINVVIEELIHHHYELPAFNQLNSLVKHTRSLVNRKIFKQIYQQLDANLLKVLDELFIIKPGYSKTGYNNLKRLPKNPTISHFKELLVHHTWLMSFGDINSYVSDIAKIKLQQFSVEAKSLDASDFKDMNEHRRYALIICLIHHAQRRAKDALSIMLSRTMSKMHKKSSDEHESLQKQQEEVTKHLLGAFHDVLAICKEEISPETLGKNVLNTMSNHGGVDVLHNECEQAVAYHSNSYLPLLWKYFTPKRPALLKLAQILKLQSASQDTSLINALHTVLNNSHNKSEYLNDPVDVSFAPEKWQALICKKEGSKNVISRRYLEMAVFSCLSNELRSGDIFIEGSETYSDYRKELLDWESCQPLLNEYCDEVGIANNAKDFVKNLRDHFIKIAEQVDSKFPDITELVIDKQGNPILKKRSPKQRSQQAIWLKQEIKNRMPERNLLDILCNTHHYTGWAYEFGPITGFDSKINDPVERHILTNFAYGTRMGATQAAKHIKADITAHMLSWINRRHVTPPLLDKAMTKLINFSNTFQIIKAWGTGKACAADGTICYIREENLIAEYHIRYGHRGGIAYHHVSDQYIALFSTFIPCGVWEAVEIIEALLKNQSDIKPDTIHADTQGQSTVVFGLAHLFGIKLMPRIRNWKDLKFFRPTKDSKYTHIDSLFSDTIDWKLIETHWADLMQVALSIKTGKMSSSLLLRKLSNYSRKNRLYKAFQELGHVIRTQFLLEYISNVELRETITATTNKVEQYNQLCDWASFGALDLVASNDEDEMEKAVKYNDIITNSVILQNIIDMSDIIHQLTQEGAEIREDDIAFLSPYLTEHIKRFGDYFIDVHRIPVQILRASKVLGFVRWRQKNAA
jgi:TnpA family transposase